MTPVLVTRSGRMSSMWTCITPPTLPPDPFPGQVNRQRFRVGTRWFARYHLRSSAQTWGQSGARGTTDLHGGTQATQGRIGDLERPRSADRAGLGARAVAPPQRF